MKKVITLLGMILLSFNLIAKDYYKEVIPLLQNEDLQNALTYLKKWDKDKKKDDDPHYYICWFNYHLIEAKNTPETAGFYVITKKDGTQSTEEMKIPSPEIMKKAVSYMSAGITKFPDRLDFYTSRHYAMKASKLNEELKDSTIEMLNHAKGNNNCWYWEEGLYEDGDKALEQELGLVSEYLLNEDDESRAFLKEICDEALKLFPEKNFPYYYTGCYYFGVKDFKKSIESFEKAVKINPEDYNSVYFLATINERFLNDKKKAIYWFKYAEKSKNFKISYAASKELLRLEGKK